MSVPALLHRLHPSVSQTGLFGQLRTPFPKLELWFLIIRKRMTSIEPIKHAPPASYYDVLLIELLPTRVAIASELLSTWKHSFKTLVTYKIGSATFCNEVNKRLWCIEVIDEVLNLVQRPAKTDASDPIRPLRPFSYVSFQGDINEGWVIQF